MMSKGTETLRDAEQSKGNGNEQQGHEALR
jgi:hypothetical protein